MGAVPDNGLQAGERRPVHRAGQPVGAWLHRELQRRVEGRAAEREDLLQSEGAKVLIEAWWRDSIRIRPHSSLGDRPPAQE